MPSSTNVLPSDAPSGSKAETDDQLSELIDDPDFLRIEGRFGGFNIFDAMGSVTGELRHSNLLAFLLSPSRPHGLGSELLQRVLRHLLAKLPRGKRPLRPLEIAIGDLENAVVHRERDAIDLLIEIGELKLVVLIENKVLSKARDGQLALYKALVRRRYSDWRHLMVFLTPDGTDPDEDGYIAFSYLEIARLIDEILQNRPASLSQDVQFILTHYLEMLRRHIVPDEELRDLARKVYERHKEAVDFIIEAMPSRNHLWSVARDLIDAQEDLELDYSTASVIRFFSTAWSNVPQYNCCPSRDWTKTKRNLLFEVKFQKLDRGRSPRVTLALILGPSNPEVRNFIYSAAGKRTKAFVGYQKFLGQHTTTIFQRELLSKAECIGRDSEESAAILTTNWNDFLEGDLTRLLEALDEIARSAPLPTT